MGTVMRPFLPPCRDWEQRRPCPNLETLRKGIFYGTVTRAELVLLTLEPTMKRGNTIRFLNIVGHIGRLFEKEIKTELDEEGSLSSAQAAREYSSKLQ